MSTAAEALGLANWYLQAGCYSQAELLFRQVLQHQPDDAETLTQLGNVLFMQKNYEAAAGHYEQALQLAPQAAAAHYNLGNALEKLLKVDEAMRYFEQALRLEPGLALAHNAVGNVLRQQDRLEEAAASYQQALRIDPKFANALINLATARHLQGRLDEAVELLQQALRINANLADAWYNMGNALQQLDRLDDAGTCYLQALRIEPRFAEAHNNLGNILRRQGNLGQAADSYLQALRLNPHSAEAHGNLGIALTNLGKLQEAEAECRQALRINPYRAEAHSNLGTALAWQGKIDEALACQEESLRLRPGFGEAHFNRALLWLLRGEFDKGWPEYEWRRQQPGFVQRTFSQPPWDGSALNGRTILLYAEQGLGDTLQFIRYAPLVAKRGGKVLVECQRSLLGLLAGVQGIAHLVPQGEPLPDFDVQSPLLSLPGIFRTTPATIPANVPYLHVDAQAMEHWRLEREQVHPLQIGIAWQGSTAFRGDRHRSIALACFAVLAGVKGVRLVSLQKGPGSEQLQSLEKRLDILDVASRLGPDDESLGQIAAIMKSLDLVICCDTAIAHLAGALGVPVWLALALVPDWRWQLHRDDSQWYPTMRLFRQTRYGQWEEVFERMAAELTRRTGNPASQAESSHLS